MQSPVSRTSELKPIELEEGLAAYQCPESGGVYIRLEDYWRWQQAESAETEKAETGEPPVHEDDLSPKICPETGALMTRFRVGHGFDFMIDRSVTGGVWLDAGEWEALRNGGLHRALHRIFTAPWQRAARSAEVAERQEQRLREKLGDALFERLAALRVEVGDHPHRPEILAFLQRTSS